MRSKLSVLLFVLLLHLRLFASMSSFFYMAGDPPTPAELQLLFEIMF